MQIYGYPGERVDFVSASGSAGSLFFGDSRSLAEEFFGPAHTQIPGGEISYFSGTIALAFADDKLTAVIVRPGNSARERVEVYRGTTRLEDAEEFRFSAG